MTSIADMPDGYPKAVCILSLWAAVKLEAKGMRRSRGPSAKVIACKQLGLPPRSTSYDTVLEQLQWLLESPPNVVQS